MKLKAFKLRHYEDKTGKLIPFYTKKNFINFNE